MEEVADSWVRGPTGKTVTWHSVCSFGLLGKKDIRIEEIEESQT